MENLNISFDDETLKKYLSNDYYLISKLKELNSKYEYSNFYQLIIQYLTSIDMSEEDARTHYYRILEHKYYLSEKMQRDIGFRVAALDYFLNIAGILKNPKFVEIDFFEQLLKSSMEDSKTGCFNAKFFFDFGEKEIRRAQRWEQNLSIIIIDIDNFKELNDQFGHLFGDKIIKKFVEILKESIRKEDILARYGGDEFAIILPQTGRIGARCLAERIKLNLTDYFNNKYYYNKKLELTFSAGISTFPQDGNSIEELIKKADIALYRAKYLGKNRIFDYLEEEYIKNQDNFKERRSFLRYKVNTSNKVFLTIDNEFFNVEGRIINISANGLLIEFSCKLNENIQGKIINLFLDEIDGYKFNNNKIKGTIARTAIENNNLKFYLGVKLNNLLDNKIWKIFEEYGNLSVP